MKKAQQNEELAEKIRKMRAKKAAAISKMDYQTAKRLDEEMEKEKQKSLQDSLKEFRKTFIASMEDLVKSYPAKYDKVYKKFSQDEKKIRLHYCKIFQETKKKHLQELASFERILLSNRDRETFCSIPEKDELISKSKQEALSGNYDKAIEYKEQASIVAAEEIRRRLAKCDADYEIQRDNALTNDCIVLGQLNQALSDELDNLSVQYKQKLDEISQQRINQITTTFQRYEQKLESTELCPLQKGHMILQNDLNLILVKYEIPPINIPFQNRSNTALGINKTNASRIPSRNSTSRMKKTLI